MLHFGQVQQPPAYAQHQYQAALPAPGAYPQAAAQPYGHQPVQGSALPQQWGAPQPGVSPVQVHERVWSGVRRRTSICLQCTFCLTCCTSFSLPMPAVSGVLACFVRNSGCHVCHSCSPQLGIRRRAQHLRPWRRLPTLPLHSR